jgi:Transposase DDE domain group 1
MIEKGTLEMQLSHSAAAVSAVFDDPNLVGSAGLVPLLRLAERCGLSEAASWLTVPAPVGANPAAKITTVVAGMAAGADAIDDLDRLRHGGMGRLFGGIRAPSTVGSFLRGFTVGQLRQLDRLNATMLTAVAAHTPLLRDIGRVCLVDIDDSIRQVYGYAKQGAEHGYTHVRGLNALLGIISTPVSAPVIAATRLRRGAAPSARRAASLVAATLAQAQRLGADPVQGLLLARMDAGFYRSDVLAAVTRAGARFSVTARQTAPVRAAIGAIEEQAWVPIRYPHAIVDPDTGELISDAEVAEAHFTAFAGAPAYRPTPGRLIVRRVRRLHPAGENQPGLVEAYRYHAVFTNSSLTMLQAESMHRGHAIIEQVIADLKAGPLAHLPSGWFCANAAWLALAALSYNLLRGLGVLASAWHGAARTSTLRDQLINLPARIASSARRLTLHLPVSWRWQQSWLQAFDST